MTADETAQYLATKGFHMDVRTVKRYRAKIKLDASKWISELARSKRNDYIYQYRERIGELEHCQNELWNIIHDQRTRQHVKVEAIGKLIDCTLKLTDLYDRMPIVNAIRDYDNTRTDLKEKENG